MSQQENSATNEQNRPIRSFVLRQGRLTKGQQYAMQHYWSLYGIEQDDSLLDFRQLFGNTRPVVLEIGFGNGESLAQMAQENPKQNFIGIEVHTPGVGHILQLIHEKQLSNIKIMNSDAMQILQQRIPAGSLSRMQIYFPDPWPKKRHHKRRLVQSEFIAQIAPLFTTKGVLHLATDWQPYAEHMAEVMQASKLFQTQATDNGAFMPRPDFRPETKFERRGLHLGHGVWDLLYQRIP